MSLTNLKIAIRNARKDGVLSFAKLFGISISFAVILFAVIYVYYETSFDKFVPDHENIYRCLMEGEINGNKADFAVTSSRMSEAVVDEIPELIDAVRMFNWSSADIEIDNTPLVVKNFLHVDSDFFKFFGLPVKQSGEELFTSHTDVAIAKSLAEQYFSTAENALGQVVKIGGVDCSITGVFDDWPSNFHLQTKFVRSIYFLNPDGDNWSTQRFYTYVKTDGKISAEDLSFKLTKTVHTHDNEGVDGANAKTWEDLKFEGGGYLFFMAESLADIHFGNHRFDPAVTSNKTYVYGAIILAILILLISSFNFINLTIASLTTRYKEMGVRKTNGAGNFQVASQFLSETILFLSLGFVIAFLIFKLGEAYLIHHIGIDINITSLESTILILVVFAFVFLFKLGTNVIPVMLYAKKDTNSLLKKDKVKGRWINVKDGFVMLQFVLSALIILSSLFVQKQINYLVEKERGYDKENVITLPMWDVSDEKRETFIKEIKSFAAIESVSSSQEYFGYDPSMNGAFFGGEEAQNYFHTSVLIVDYDFVRTFDIELQQGRFFQEDIESDNDAVLINEAAAKYYLGDEQILETTVGINGYSHKILGVVKDFNYRSLHHELLPLVIRPSKNGGAVYAKVKTGSTQMVLDYLRKTRKDLGITKDMDYAFHDDVISNHYIKDQQAKRLLFFLSLVSVLIACVGLYAISFFTIAQRTKEIGTRKVNGATAMQVVLLLNRDFVKWVALAFLIAVPIAYYAMNEWLNNFAYQTELSWWVFALAGVVALGVALITVSWQSFKAAMQNPIESLRYE